MSVESIRVGDIPELTVESIAYRGSGIARYNGMAVFVPGTCPGERVRARVSLTRARYAEAEVIEILEAAPERITPECTLRGESGATLSVPGCVYGHISYEGEIAAKQRQLDDFLSRQAGLEGLADIARPPTPSPKSLHYRNKITLHAGSDERGFALGYKGEDNVSVVDIPACPLADAAINELLADLRRDPRFRSTIESGESLTIRYSPNDGAVAWIEPAPAREPPLGMPSPLGILEVPCDAFYQINNAVADLLLERVAEVVAEIKPAALLDAHCGVGVFALAGARAGAERVLAMDTSASAIEAARRNSKRLGLPAQFARIPAAEGLRHAFEEVGTDGTCVVLDPPRSGLDRGTLELLVRERPSSIIYMSCSPDMLARDLRRITGAGGYIPRSYSLFDMFPRTAHFETIIVLERGGRA